MASISSAYVMSLSKLWQAIKSKPAFSVLSLHIKSHIFPHLRTPAVPHSANIQPSSTFWFNYRHDWIFISFFYRSHLKWRALLHHSWVRSSGAWSSQLNGSCKSAQLYNHMNQPYGSILIQLLYIHTCSSHSPPWPSGSLQLIGVCQ